MAQTHGQKRAMEFVDRSDKMTKRMNRVEKRRKHGFLSFPAEIRNKVYGLVFDDLEWEIGCKDKFKAMSGPQNALSLLQTCHQINWEAQKLPYSLSNFILKPGLDANTVVPGGASWIKSMVLSDWGFCYLLKPNRAGSGIFRLREYFPSLEKIDIISGVEKDPAELFDVVALEGMKVASIVSECFPNASISLRVITDKKKTVIEGKELQDTLSNYEQILPVEYKAGWNKWFNGTISSTQVDHAVLEPF